MEYLKDTDYTPPFPEGDDTPDISQPLRSKYGEVCRLAQDGDFEGMREALAQGHHPRYYFSEFLRLAFSGGHLDLANWLVSQGANPHAITLTILERAIGRKRYGVVETLVNLHNYNVNFHHGKLLGML